MTSARLTMGVLLGVALSHVPASAQSRGELLYTSLCIACHSEQVHWRDGRLATDWPSLRAQVVRWQATASLNWNDDDIGAVTQYLNERFYGFRSPAGPPLVLKPGDGRNR